MAFVTKNRSGTWEIRESRSTPAGPRSKTLASFKMLEHHHLVLATERSATELDTDSLIASARKAGAPIALSAADQAALDLLRAIGDQSNLSANLATLLRDALDEGPNSDSTDEAFGHIGKSPDDRGAEIIDLLLLTDAYPVTELRSALTFPGIPETRG
jgi:hypothetical protein